MSTLRRHLYRAARDLGDIEAVASGNPARVGRRLVRKAVYRNTGRTTRRLLRLLGL